MLTEEMRALIQTYNAGSVATVNADGTPSVSPKATFVILDAATLAFGNLRSPGTIANIRRSPAVEICFTDVLARKAVRVTGTATYVPRSDADGALRKAFTDGWSDFVEHMAGFVRVEVSAAQMILSPAYDRGAEEADLVATNLAKLNAL